MTTPAPMKSTMTKRMIKVLIIRLIRSQRTFKEQPEEAQEGHKKQSPSRNASAVVVMGSLIIKLRLVC
jgi:hypothetical protein